MTIRAFYGILIVVTKRQWIAEIVEEATQEVWEDMLEEEGISIFQQYRPGTMEWILFFAEKYEQQVWDGEGEDVATLLVVSINRFPTIEDKDGENQALSAKIASRVARNYLLDFNIKIQVRKLEELLFYVQEDVAYAIEESKQSK